MRLTASALAVLICVAAVAQSPEVSPSETDLLNKKVDEINVKLDALSQQMLKIEQQLSRPGVMIGEATPTPSAAPAVSVDAVHANGTSHVVARGETLTSIAKQYKVGVDELQKFNHIEDGRKLQAGQTILIPSASASPSPSASPSGG
jgi:LysM repeat protein